MSYQDFSPALLTLSPRSTKSGDPSSSVVGINTTPLADGALVYCAENKGEYQLDKTDSTTPPDGNLVLAPLVGPGRWFKRLPASGGAVTGPPDAIAYYDAVGNITGDAAFTALPIDVFGRPQLWDRRIVGGPGTGAVWRNGAWQVDGDPTNVQGEGYVTYGPAENGLQDGSNGAFGRVKYNRFGIRYIIGGVDIGYAWRVDPTHEFFTNDAGVMTAEIVRATGQGRFVTVQIGALAGPGLSTIDTQATVARPFHLPDISGTAVVIDDATGKVWMGLGVTGDVVSSNAGMQYSTLVANRAQLRMNQFGANSAGPGATGFKSRGATLGAFAGCVNGDLLYRITAIGVAPNNVDVPLAATGTFQVPPGFVPAGQNYLPTEWEIALVPLAGPINGKRVAQLVTSEGETQTLSGVRAGGPGTLPTALGAGTLWSSGTGDPNGAVTGSVGDLWSRTDGGANTTLYVKESGAATNTGWVAK